MKALTHESLTVYERAIEFVAWSAELCHTKKVTGEIQKQFKRAFISIPLNIAEGSGKQTGKDQARFYDIARGSTLECGACLDVMVAMQIATEPEILRGKKLLAEIVAMLTALAKSVAGERVQEEQQPYNTPEDA